MVAVAAGNEVAVDLEVFAAVRVGYARPATMEVMNGDGPGFPNDLAAGSRMRIPQILLYLGLTVDHHASTGEIF